MQRVAYFGGEYLPVEQARASVEDRGYVFGDGAYEVVITFGRTPFGLSEHIERFFRSLRRLEIEPPHTRRQIADIARGALERVTGENLMIYFQATRGTAPRAHAYPEHMSANFLMIVSPRKQLEEQRERGVKAVLADDVRWQMCDVKSLNLIPNVMAATRAERAGAMEAIFHRQGRVTEGASSNAYIVKDGVAYTAPLGPEILPGITRAHLTPLFADIGVPLREQWFGVDELKSADEVFVTASNKLVMPVVQIEDAAIGEGKPGPVTRRLYAEYMASIQRAVNAFDWEGLYSYNG